MKHPDDSNSEASLKTGEPEPLADLKTLEVTQVESESGPEPTTSEVPSPIIEKVPDLPPKTRKETYARFRGKHIVQISEHFVTTKSNEYCVAACIDKGHTWCTETSSSWGRCYEDLQ